MDGAVDEVFLNVTPLHRAGRYIQSELNKLQVSVRNVQNKMDIETHPKEANANANAVSLAGMETNTF